MPTIDAAPSQVSSRYSRQDIERHLADLVARVNDHQSGNSTSVAAAPELAGRIDWASPGREAQISAVKQDERGRDNVGQSLSFDRVRPARPGHGHDSVPPAPPPRDPDRRRGGYMRR